MSGIEIITDGGPRRQWTAGEKLRIVEEALDGRDSISVVARRNGVAPNLVYRWRRLMLAGGSVAVAGDDDVTSNRQVREMETRIRELERQLGSPRPWRWRSCAKRLIAHAPKNRPCSCARPCRRISGERCHCHARRQPIGPLRPAWRSHQSARPLHQGR